MKGNISNPGQLVVVVGPSGAGKDTLLDYARERLTRNASVRFVRRAITRPVSVGEAHEPIDTEEFARREKQGEFALSWHAHGLSYGLPLCIADWIAEGSIVVANGSRGILPAARERFPGMIVVSVNVTDDVLASRLASRGREDGPTIAARLKRASALPVKGPDVIELDNSGAIGLAGEQLVSLLRTARRSVWSFS